MPRLEKNSLVGILVVSFNLLTILPHYDTLTISFRVRAFVSSDEERFPVTLKKSLCAFCGRTKIRAWQRPDEDRCVSCKDAGYPGPLPLWAQHVRTAWCSCVECLAFFDALWEGPPVPKYQNHLIYGDEPVRIERAMAFVTSVTPNRRVLRCAQECCGGLLRRGCCVDCGRYDAQHEQKWEGLRILRSLPLLRRGQYSR